MKGKKCSLIPTMNRSAEASVESLRIDVVDVLSVCSMEQLFLIVFFSILIHFLFYYHVRLVKKRILYSLNLQNIHSASSMELGLDILILGGNRVELYGQNFSARWHRRPVARKRNSLIFFEIKMDG